MMRGMRMMFRGLLMVLGCFFWREILSSVCRTAAYPSVQQSNTAWAS